MTIFLLCATTNQTNVSVAFAAHLRVATSQRVIRVIGGDLGTSNWAVAQNPHDVDEIVVATPTQAVSTRLGLAAATLAPQVAANADAYVFVTLRDNETTTVQHVSRDVRHVMSSRAFDTSAIALPLTCDSSTHSIGLTHNFLAVSAMFRETLTQLFTTSLLRVQTNPNWTFEAQVADTFLALIVQPLLSVASTRSRWQTCEQVARTSATPWKFQFAHETSDVDWRAPFGHFNVVF